MAFQNVISTKPSHLCQCGSSVSITFAFLSSCIRYLLLCNKFPPNLMVYNNTYYLELFWVRDLGVANWVLRCRALAKVQSMSARAVFFSKLSYSLGQCWILKSLSISFTWLLAGFSSLFTIGQTWLSGLSNVTIGAAHKMATCFISASKVEESKREHAGELEIKIFYT